ncbi:SNF1-related protein kinase catalytic subunit alpha KIN11, partial [Dichanthelium oligosanthes]
LRGRYELLSLRGQGSFAEVWEARHLRTGLRVAIKIILCHANATTKNNKDDVEREIRVMRLLRHHPHVVRFHEAIVAGDHTYIVMELAESGELYDHVAIRERLPEAQARRIFQQLVAGVAYCHRNMVVHRDLKMENVMLDAEGNVKIVDFGFSKLFRYTQLQSESCGSPQYAAPELLDGREYLGPEVDVWSCGVILYGMLCGGLPFDGADISDLPRNIRRGEYHRLPSWVSDDARDLISSIFIVRPQKRASMSEVRAHRWLQPDMPPYLALAMPPPDQQACMRIDAATVELLVTRHGFERSTLLESLHRIEDQDSEEAVAYQLVLTKQYDAATRYQLLSMPPPQQLQHGRRRPWALVGLDDGGGELLLFHECPRETMRRVAKALGELGICILFHHTHRHRMVCAHVPGIRVPSAASFFFNDDDGSSSSSPAPATDDDAALEMNNIILESLPAAVFFEVQHSVACLQLDKAGEGNHNHNPTAPAAVPYELRVERTSGPQLPYLRVCSQLKSKLRRRRTDHK